MLHKIKKVSALVVGDVILDVFFKGKASKLSPEAPVPVINIQNEIECLGGAANVAANLKSLGCGRVDLVGFIGQDNCANSINNLLKKLHINNNCVINKKIPTTSKTRIIASDQHIVRFDKEVILSEKFNRHLLYLSIEKLKNSYDFVILSDYNKGTISKEIVDLIKLKFSESLLFADIKPSNYIWFNDFYCITPNLVEAEQMLSVKCDEQNLAQQIKNKLNLKCIVITLSENGLYFLNKKNVGSHLPAYICKSIKHERHHRIDVTGAGDTLVATLASCHASGISFEKSVYLSNIAASIVVNKLGTSVCSFEELKNEVDSV